MTEPVPSKRGLESSTSDPKARPAKKHRGSGRRSTRPDNDNAAEGDEEKKEQRLPKRAVALLIGFAGTGYYGMQFQVTGVKTIEGTVFDALVKAGAVSKDNADDPVKVKWQRAARTDAGVHAAGNIVSLRMITDLPGVDDLRALINSFLPPEIRLWGYVRTQNSFNARTTCDSRKYTYFMPTYVLLPPKPGSNLSESLKSVHDPVPTGDPFPHPFWKDATGGLDPEDVHRKRLFRISQEEMATFREVVKRFEGSHNYYNFTIQREYNDRASRRVMKTIEVSDPVVYGDTEWISVRIHGQSFMLHQRKMICAAIMAARTRTPPGIIIEMYGPNKIVVPKAPALGLLLEYPVFEQYNERTAECNAKIREDDPERENLLRPPIDFELYRDDLERFKEEHIYANMRENESRSGIFDGWIRSIDCYSGPDLQYYNPQGNILPQCVWKKGENRHAGFREERKFDAIGPDGAVPEDVGDLDEERVDNALLAELEG